MAIVRDKVLPAGPRIVLALQDMVLWRGTLYVPQSFVTSTSPNGTFVLEIPPGRYRFSIGQLTGDVVIPDEAVRLQDLLQPEVPSA